MLYERYFQWTELLYLLVLKELKVRYKRSVLGYLWAVTNPLVFALVYWVAFKFIMHVQTENYIVFILTGIFPWAWLNQSITQGTGSFTNNLSLVRRVTLPKILLPLSIVLQEMVHYIFAIPVVFFFIILIGVHTDFLSMLWQIPLMLFLQVFFIFPLTLIGAVLNVYVRDIQYLVGIFFSVLFYVTPMVYPLNMVPKNFQQFFKLNPVLWLIDSWRIVFAGDVLPLENMAWLLGSIILFSLIALLTYFKLATRISELV